MTFTPQLMTVWASQWGQISPREVKGFDLVFRTLKGPGKCREGGSGHPGDGGERTRREGLLGKSRDRGLG